MEPGFANDYRAKRRAAYARWQQWIQGHETLAKFSMALVFAGIMGALAQVSIRTDLSPVPFTMQVFGASLMGGMLGRKWGTISALLYVALGIIGLPMFAGQAAAWDGFHPFGGFFVFATALSSWYIVGFVAQAFIVGHVTDSRRGHRSGMLVAFAPIAIMGLLSFVILDAYFLRDYRDIYPTSAFPNAWFLLLTLGLIVIVAGVAWVALTRKARQERIELFFANIAGLLALYAIGALGFLILWHVLGNGPLPVSVWLAYTVLPFIPVDLAKILLAVGVLTLVRPTQGELAEHGWTPPKEASESHV